MYTYFFSLEFKHIVKLLTFYYYFMDNINKNETKTKKKKLNYYKNS